MVGNHPRLYAVLDLHLHHAEYVIVFLCCVDLDELHAMERMRNSVCASTAADLQDEKEGVQSEGHDG